MENNLDTDQIKGAGMAAGISVHAGSICERVFTVS